MQNFCTAYRTAKQQKKPTMAQETHNQASPYSFPPGFLGELARFIYGAAPRPVPEIALAGAIGLLAGIVGRAYNVSNPPIGLNQYVLLLAPTGTGKEAVSSGVTALMKSIRSTLPASTGFIGPGEIASSQAVIKYMAGGQPSFVSIVGEFGIYLQQMTGPKAPPHLVGLRRFLLDAYGKSGAYGEIRPSIYSDKEKNTAAIQSPALSLIGESTPEKFYEGLNEGLISEGLLPRFPMIEYHGERPYLNEEACAVPPPNLIANLAELCSHSLNLNHQGHPVTVQLNDESRAMFDDFNSYADEQIRGSGEVTRQLWNRAHLKALKLAALVAVGWNPYMPTITPDFALWAIQLEKANVRNLLARFEAGEVGETSSEDMRVKRVIGAIIAYCQKPWQELKSYDVRGDLHEKRIVTYTYIHKKLAATAPFKKQNNQEPTRLIKEALRTLVDRGDIVELSKAVMARDYQFNGLAYMVANHKAFGI